MIPHSTGLRSKEADSLLGEQHLKGCEQKMEAVQFCLLFCSCMLSTVPSVTALHVQCPAEL